MSDLHSQVVCGDCLHALENIQNSTVDLAYLDPPFFTNKHHSSVSRDRNKKFEFADLWNGLTDYADFMAKRIRQIHRVLKETGSIFVHCDTNANFLLRAILDDTFGHNQFRSEIIWSYRRWSNSAKGLLPAHQTILFYSKTDHYKFHRIYGSYSETTNIDQILQLRARDEHGVSKYATDKSGNVIYGGDKKGVPLSDVWEIPFLNPKARERTGYPTQKPILLLERIIEICTDAGDLVLDPFCGSGTTLVAANLLGRSSIGIDISGEAVGLAERRLSTPIKTESAMLKKGRASYVNADKDALSLLAGIDLLPVQRNAGIDAFLQVKIDGSLVPIRVQRPGESIMEAASKLARAANSKKAARAVLVRTHKDDSLFSEGMLPKFIELIDSTALRVGERIAGLLAERVTEKAANTSLQGTLRDKAAQRP
ncbi:MAG: site-specific DNA-methyltransferase [Lysobacteraceae bacterium]